MRELFVVVSGAPGSGKSTLARELAPRLGLPLFMKDTIKEALGDVLGADDIVASKRLGSATMEVLIALAKANVGAVLESTWHRELALPDLAQLPSRIVEVNCAPPPEVAQLRYVTRVGTRHPVHFDEEQDAGVEGFIARHPQSVAGDWPLVTVDTTRPVDFDALAEQILHA